MSRRESELKFTHEVHSSDNLLRSLQRTCNPDGKFQSNIINSIYFDTHDWRLAMEKASSDYLKSKVRLRWYQSNNKNDQQTLSKCFLEFKRKIGSKREKTRIEMPFDGTSAICEVQKPATQRLLQEHIARNAPDLVGFDLSAKILVQYTRHRFIEQMSNTRISLDTNIKASSIDRSFAQDFSKIRLKDAVLEVKGDCEDLPFALRRVNACNLKKAAFSKYYESFVLLSGYQQ
ncbi:MAG: VTC domain-containing protein [Arenicella sp.]